MPHLALIVDYAGVMTVPLRAALHAWMVGDGLDPVRCGPFMRELESRSAHEQDGPVYGLETGTWSPERFERAMAAELAAAGLGTVAAEGLLKRMFGELTPDPAMASLVAGARDAGVRTALLSNSFGVEYPRADWPRLFDVTVISEEVGLRKPDPAIYRLACEQLGLAPEQAVFVDDMPENVTAAEALGMAVHHADLAATRSRLEVLLGVALG